MSSLFHFYVVNIYVTCKSILYLASIFSISLIYILYISSLYTKCKWSDNNSLLIYKFILNLWFIFIFIRCKERGLVNGMTGRFNLHSKQLERNHSCFSCILWRTAIFHHFCSLCIHSSQNHWTDIRTHKLSFWYPYVVSNHRIHRIIKSFFPL